MKNWTKKLGIELRRIRWANTKTTSKTFIYTIIFVAIFSGIIVLFSWGVTSLINVMGG